jgi:hypothetical protein
MDNLLLPPPDEVEWLLDSLTRLVAARGPGPLVSNAILEPMTTYFPDRWTGTPRAVEILAKRLLGYVGIDHIEAIVDTEAFTDEREAGECGLEHADLPIWFAGLAEGTCLFGVREESLEDAEIAAAALGHAVAHAFRAHHGIAAGARWEGSYRERPARLAQVEALEERITDVTTVYLGFGVIMANASERKRSQGEVRGSMATWRITTTRVGTLEPQSMSYLLAVQAVVRGLTPRERKGLSKLLDTNQAAFFEAACAALGEGGVDALRARLGVPAPEKWPAPLDLTELTRPDPEAARAVVVTKKSPKTELSNRGRPIFRVIAHQGVSMTALFTVLGMFPLGLALSWSVLLTPLAMTALGVIGYQIGKTRRRDECSDIQCEGPLAQGLEECPKCGGTIRGEIKRREDRLAALEALEDEKRARRAKRARK